MKRVLMITQNFYPEIGSAANRMKNIYMELKEAGYEVTVLTPSPSYPNQNLYKDEAYWTDEHIEADVVRIHPKTRKYTHNIFKRLMLYLEVAARLILCTLRLKKEYDYIFVSTPAIFIPLAGIFAKRKMKAKLILDVRDLWPDSLIGVGVFQQRWVLKSAYWLERFIYRHADHIIINSQGFRTYIEAKGIPPQRISFMPNSLTDSELHMLPMDTQTEKVTVIYTGNIGLAQDIMKLIEVAERMQVYEDIEFVIVGYGYKKNVVKELIQQKNLTNIRFLKPKNRQQTLEEVAKAHIAYVSLSDKEVFETVLPGKVIDYMCVGKPMVADVSGYAHQVIKKAQCGIVAVTRTSEEIERSILRLAQDPGLRKQLGKNGHAYAYQELRWKTNIEALLSIMEEKHV
ncbi:glycosyltransferase family 4 protein [Ectobacillus sp. JY-23]|uniref:glycosyltransferase family 4 protein n=1 Tax=Ectobacillus sp. JY-23 TaxID=2933872 RepID=UPI0034A02FD6